MHAVCSLTRLLEEVTVDINHIHQDVHSLFFVIAARRGLTSYTSGPSQTPTPESRGVSDLSTAGELPRVHIRVCGADGTLKRYMYDGAVSLGMAARTEGVVVARLVREVADVPSTSSRWKFETVGHPVDRDGPKSASMGAGAFSPSGGVPARSFLCGIKDWLDKEDHEPSTPDNEFLDQMD